MQGNKEELCTWVGCDRVATVPLRATDGEIWANLCGDHAKKHGDGVDHAVKQGDTGIRKMLSNWVKAQGGSKVASGRIFRKKS